MALGNAMLPDGDRRKLTRLQGINLSAAATFFRQVGGTLGVRVRQAAVLLAPDHLDEDADADRGDRA